MIWKWGFSAGLEIPAPFGDFKELTSFIELPAEREKIEPVLLEDDKQRVGKEETEGKGEWRKTKIILDARLVFWPKLRTITRSHRHQLTVCY